MRLVVRILLLVALPGVIFGSLVRASAARGPECGNGGSGLLSLFQLQSCPRTDDGALVAIGLILVLAVIVVGVARARPQ